VRAPIRALVGVSLLLVSAVLGGTLVRAQADPPDPNPALELHLDTVAGDGTTPDSSANGLTGRVTGPLGAGRWGQGLAPANDGDGDGVRVDDNDALKPSSLTLVAWVKRSGTPGTNRIIVGKQGLIPATGEVPCAGYSYALITGPSGGLRFTLETDQGTAIESETPELSSTTAWDGNWHVVAGTWDGSSMQLWVDGQAQGSPTSVGNFPILQGDGDTYPAALFAGYADHGAVTSCDASGARYTGALDEIRLYPRALSSDEMAYLARGDLTSPPDLANPQPWPPPHTHIALIPVSPNARGYYDSSIHVQVTSTPAEPGRAVEIRCVLDPSTVPTSFSDLPPGCPYGSPTAIAALGSHDLYAAGRDPSGSAETTIAHSHFQIAAAPETTILDGPSGSVVGTTFPFSFVASVRRSTFECQIDGAAFAPCSSPYTTPALTDGTHTFIVRATNPSGITDPTPASRTFQVNAPAEYSPTCTVTGVTSFFTEDANRIACEIGTLTGSCPDGVVCVDRSVRCPIGARCTVTTTATWFDADEQINWSATARAGNQGFVRPSAVDGFPNYITSPPTASVDTTCSTGLDGDRCSTRSTVEVIGDLRPLFSGCTASLDPFLGTVFGPDPTLGDDDIRRIECQADWQIGPAGALDTVPIGPTTIQTYAPAAGQLTLTPGKLFVAHHAAAAARMTARIAPAHIKVTHPGAVTISLKLNGAATRLLHRSRHLRVTLRLTFTPVHGAEVRTSRTVTITAPAPRRKHCQVPRRAKHLRHLPRCLTHR
jgi:hypothetical protein